MADNTAALIAQISALQEEIVEVSAERDALDQELTQVEAQLGTAKAEATKVPALQSRVAELEKLLAPPPPQSGILTVSYSDGRIKYAAPDGDKFILAADAEHHAQVLILTGLYGMTEAQAEIALARGFIPP